MRWSSFLYRLRLDHLEPIGVGSTRLDVTRAWALAVENGVSAERLAPRRGQRDRVPRFNRGYNVCAVKEADLD